MSLPIENTDDPKDTQFRSSSRERKLTEKGQELHDQDTKKREKAFDKTYDSWKLVARKTRTELKTLCSSEDLNELQQDIQAKHDDLGQQYEPILRTSNRDCKENGCLCYTNKINV